MSESSVDISVTNDPWLKLYHYLTFRSECGGAWVNSEPPLWYNIIMSKDISMTVIYCDDSGGGPMASYTVKAEEIGFEKPKLLYGFEKTYDSIAGQRRDDTKLIDKLRMAYFHMQRRYDGKSWEASLSKFARNYEKIHEELKGVYMDSWYTVFGLKKRYTHKPANIDKDITYISMAGFMMMSANYQLGYFPYEVEEDEPMDERIQIAKRFAEATIIEMLRYYDTSC